jgi:glycine cleavage system H protein
MPYPANYRYTREHEWISLDGTIGAIGITDYAQNSLGDIVYVELPRVGQTVAAHASIGVVESVKAVSELFNPVAGEVLEINAALEKDPSTVNRDAFGEGWMYRVKVAGAPDGLLDAAEYDRFVASA